MPKKKGGKKKGTKIIDGLSTSEMSRDQLLGHIKRLQTELEREREERNFFMLERDKLCSLWHSTTERLQNEKDNSKFLEVTMENANIKMMEDMSAYKQKIRYMMSEQVQKLGTVRLAHLKRMKLLQNDFLEIQEILKERSQGTRKELRQTQANIVEVLRRLKLEQMEKLGQLRTYQFSELRRLETATDIRLNRELKTIETIADLENSRVLNSKNGQINQMISVHEDQLIQLQGYFKDLTANNFAIMASLQEEIERKTIEIERNQQIFEKCIHVQSKNSVPLDKHNEVIKELSESSSRTRALTRHLDEARKMIKEDQGQLRKLETEQEALIQKANIPEAQLRTLKACLTKAILDLQRKASMRNLIIQLETKGNLFDLNNKDALKNTVQNQF